MTILLHNTMTRSRDIFQPMDSSMARMYTCGPTVYNFAHIGNLRTYLFEDLLKRVLMANGQTVKHVMNITDVGHLTDDELEDGEDKMEAGARREGRTVWEIARHYEEAFFRDTGLLNIIDPDIRCRATEHIQDMIALIEKLEKRGFTYVANGNVYFDITKFSDYGKLARISLEDLKAGARIEVDQAKRNPHDFVLWFTNSKFDNQTMQWESPWGRGFPGWHIECSAMSMKYLGESFDIHCGGIDHIPIHHTNEIAQSEGATGKTWVNYWIHGEFLVMDKGKMAKSAGNFLTLQTLIDNGYSPLDYRFLCLGAHYRAQLSFSWEALKSAAQARASLNRKVMELARRASALPEDSSESLEKLCPDFLEAINDDLNTPRGLSALNGLIRKAGSDISASLALQTIFAMDNVLGLGLRDVASTGLAQFDEISEDSAPLPSEVAQLAEERIRARADKNWKESDILRDRIKNLGYSVVDSKQGQLVKPL
ncbi:MAG: cysteine--tRNA ligase [Candidatus Wallbacteria bacterium HGW-Wallbacteria-1]|jgi:cysteinyl-tRNA synthetase|uniref:Cysteine--tRNA ligase n=1 Tax=Candidatus Wallbacteria bacterium HGW-Wallbacteria-1 TaxID=2013854 RepID=A0A2N1PV26_9BACT|nr:MAG: cysteine--tRNA ligase [Candidatus Wallbacteria bacterium HGW-Wallbacteria-1]